MTKDAYFEVCETMGTEPVESEIPVDYGDFSPIVQQSLLIYSMLRDCWEPMGGTYLGKDMSILFEFFNLYELDKEEKALHVMLLQIIDDTRAKLLASKKPKAEKPLPRKP